MNKHRQKSRAMSIPEMSLLITAAVVLMSAGFVHAWIKNSHVEVIREVDQTQQRINDHEDSINSLQVKIDKKLNIYQLRDDLERSGSRLVTVPVSAIEKIPAHHRRDGNNNEVAGLPDRASTVAQRRP